MLRSLGGGSKLTLGRKHRTVGRLWFHGTEFNSWQHNHSRQHRHPTSRYNAEQSWIHISGDFSEYHGPRLYFSQWSARCHNAGNDQPGLDFSGWNARRDHSRFDSAEWHAEYNHPGIDIAEWQSEHDDSWINVAQRCAEHDYATNHASGYHATFNNSAWQFIHHRRDQ